jgi:hypothetical protein
MIDENKYTAWPRIWAWVYGIQHLESIHLSPDRLLWYPRCQVLIFRDTGRFRGSYHLLHMSINLAEHTNFAGEVCCTPYVRGGNTQSSRLMYSGTRPVNQQELMGPGQGDTASNVRIFQNGLPAYSHIGIWKRMQTNLNKKEWHQVIKGRVWLWHLTLMILCSSTEALSVCYRLLLCPTAEKPPSNATYLLPVCQTSPVTCSDRAKFHAGLFHTAVTKWCMIPTLSRFVIRQIPFANDHSSHHKQL